MQDRFKFRAYYKVDKKMHNVNAVIAQENCIELFEVGEEPSPEDFKGIITARKEMCVLMQCTGLKDKNGKLIYEGDILFEDWKNEVYPKGRYWIVKWNKNHANFYIEMVNPSKYANFKEWHLARHNLDYEIIGNIYENKDLLAKDTTNE